MRRLHSFLGVSVSIALVACGTDSGNGTGTPASSMPVSGANPMSTTGANMPSSGNTSAAPATPSSVVGTPSAKPPGSSTPPVGTPSAVPPGNSAKPMNTTSTPTPTGPVGTVPAPMNSATPVPTTPVARPGLVTSGEGAYWTEGKLTESTGTADVTVDDTKPAQAWLGMGGAFNEMGWDALSVVDAAERDRAVQLLFGTGAEGARFNYGRIPIGASDYAIKRYTLADTKDDFMMEKFSIEPDRKLLIPYIKAAVAVNPAVHLWGSPWTPPPWMKSNGDYDGGNMKDDDKTFNAHALYLSRFVEDYGKEGLKIEAVAPQNEPGFVQNYPSCGWTSGQYVKYIKDFLGPTFATRGVKADIWCGTMSASADGKIATDVAADAGAMKFVKAFGLQWGTRGVIGQLKAKAPVFQTEHQAGNYPDFTPENPSPLLEQRSTGKAPNNHAYAQDSWVLIRDWIKGGVSGYSAWNMILDTVGLGIDTKRQWWQDTLIAVDRSAKKLVITPTYYVFKHISYFADPGGQVVGASGGDALAFKNPDGTLVAVLYNSGAAKMSTVAIGGKKFQVNVPAKGWATVSYKP